MGRKRHGLDYMLHFHEVGVVDGPCDHFFRCPLLTDSLCGSHLRGLGGRVEASEEEAVEEEGQQEAGGEAQGQQRAWRGLVAHQVVAAHTTAPHTQV